MPQKIIIHTQYYPPEIGAPQNRLSELAVGLAKRGYSVTVLTAFPNYPFGRIFKGYKGFVIREKHDKVQIIRSPIVPSQKMAFLPRLINYFSFVLTSFVVGVLFLPRADYLLTESPPLFLGISGFLLSRIKGAKWILNVSDLWPESAAELGVINRDSFSYKISSKLESFLYFRAWLITGQSATIIKNILKRHPNLNTYHLSNGVDTSLFSAEQPEEGRSVTVVYAGLHGIAQGLDQVLQAAAKLQNYPMNFLFVGDGPEKKRLVQVKESLGLENVRFEDPVSKGKIPTLLAGADILLVPLKIQLTGAVPSKLYEAMAASRPVILIAEGEAAHIAEDTHCGVTVKPGDVEVLVKEILRLGANRQLRVDMGIAGRQAAMQRYDRSKIIDQFVTFLKKKL